MLHYANLYHLIQCFCLKHSRLHSDYKKSPALPGTLGSNLLQLTCTDLPHHDELVHPTGQQTRAHINVCRARKPQMINYAFDPPGHFNRTSLYSSLLVEYYSQHMLQAGKQAAVSKLHCSAPVFVNERRNLKSPSAISHQLQNNVSLPRGQVIFNQRLKNETASSLQTVGAAFRFVESIS